MRQRECVTSKVLSITPSKDSEPFEKYDIEWLVYYDDGSVDNVVAKDVENPFLSFDDLSFKDDDMWKRWLRIYTYNCAEPISYCSKVTSEKVKDADPLELTMEDIEKEFGRKVMIVKEK